MNQIKIEKVPYAGWPNCYRVTDGEIELISTSDVGPRILRCGFVGGQNLFYECKPQLGNSGEPWWLIRGGHRLWRAPELVPDTYALDNAPVEARIKEGETLSLLQRIEPETGLRKEISIRLDGAGCAQIVHRIENTGSKTVRLAPWALTVMAAGGRGIAAFPRRGSHDENLLPTNPLVMWAYTDFSDNRWSFTRKYLLLRQDPRIVSPQKAGLFNEKTCAAYLLGTDLFVKRCEASRAAMYPDYGCSFEVFTNNDFLELETLGALVDVLPGNSVSHVESWLLRRDVRLKAFSDDELDRVLEPLMQ